MASIVDLLLKIEKRPAMYISRHSIVCLKAFLDGWYLRSPQDVSDADIMEKYQDWICEKYNVKTSHSWDRILLFYSQDEFDALNLFFSIFNDFKVTKYNR
jgi:hypothetical protein